MLQQNSFRLGEFRVEPLEYAIYLSETEKQSLQPKFIDVLCYLASQYPRVVPRQELIEHIWQGNGYVGEKALTNAIWHLRQALKHPDGSESIQTIRKSGYQLLREPEYLLPPKTVAQPVSESTAPNEGRKSPPLWLWVFPLPFAILLFWWLQSDSRSVIADIEVITTQPGMELFPAPTPDGRHVVYKWRRPDGSMDLYLQDTQQPNLAPKQLTFDEENEGRAVWDMTGEYLYFRRKNDDLETCHMVKLDAQSLQEQIIGKCPLGGDLHYLDITPDNNTLAYWGLEGLADKPAIYRRRINNESNDTPVCLTECDMRDRDIAFSPNGQYLAISRRLSRFSENIYLHDLATGKERLMIEGESDIVGITWHPDGKHIVYGVQRADSRSGYLLNVITGQLTPLNIKGFSYPSFAKKQPWLYFQTRSEFYQIAYLPLANEFPSSPFPFLQSDYNHKYPDYSNASDRIAYLSNESGNYEIWIADANGNQRQQLTELKRPVLFPKWSNDGKRIAFLAANADGSGDSLMVVEVATKRISRVPSPYNAHYRATWTADDSALVASIYLNEGSEERERELFLLPLDGSPVKQLTNDGGRHGVLLDDGSLLYTRSEPGLYKLSPSDEKGQLLINAEQFGTRYSWTLSDAGSIYFIDPGTRYKDIKRYDTQTGVVEPILRLPVPEVVTESSFSLDSKRQRLLFSNTIKYQSDIKRLKHLELN